VPDGAFQVATDGVLRHLSSFLNRLAKSANLGDRRHDDVVSVFLRLKQNRVLVPLHGSSLDLYVSAFSNRF
jgi:hypothetical protein